MFGPMSTLLFTQITDLVVYSVLLQTGQFLVLKYNVLVYETGETFKWSEPELVIIAPSIKIQAKKVF